MRYPDSRLMVFSKAPVSRQVKTRLAKDIGDENAVKIHQFLLRHCLKTVCGLKLAPVELWCAPSAGHPFFQQCKAEYDISLREQAGVNLGERMSHAFMDVLSRANNAVVIGTDCPLIDADYMQDAFYRLTSRQCTVIGPAEDGGYVLLGMCQHDDTLFNGIAWGSDQVLSQTQQKAVDEIELLPLRWDIDESADLQRLYLTMDSLNLEEGFRVLIGDVAADLN